MSDEIYTENLLKYMTCTEATHPSDCQCGGTARIINRARDLMEEKETDPPKTDPQDWKTKRKNHIPKWLRRDR